MAEPTVAITQLQQQKPQTYTALNGLIAALANLPHEDGTVATMVRAISAQLTNASPAQPTPSSATPATTIPRTQEFNRETMRGMMQPM